MPHNQNTITQHYQQLQSYERGLIMAQQSDGWSFRRRASCHSVSWLLKAPEFFRQLVMELRQKPRVHNVDSFVHWFKLTALNYLVPQLRPFIAISMKVA